LRFTSEVDGEFDVAGWMNRWAEQGPTHHVALGVGHHSETIEKFGKLMGLECVRVN
jgi:L-arabinose isomerase